MKRRQRERKYRVESALSREPWVSSQARALGAEIKISDRGRHWRFYAGDGSIIQWWPSGAGKIYHSEFGKLPPVSDVEEFVGVLVALLSEVRTTPAAEAFEDENAPMWA